MAANGSELKNLNMKYNIGHFTPDQKKMPRTKQGIICFLVARGGIDQGLRSSHPI
jgi:hypothetical protein